MRAAIAAAVSLDGSPVTRRELEVLAGQARLPWGGNPRLFLCNGAGLICVPARSTESSPDQKPSSRFHAVVDGMLDNRFELAGRFGLPSDPAGVPGLVVAAHEQWGADCADHLIGELAFLLWDDFERRLFAARDAFGLRELFYRADATRFWIASQLQMILPRPDLSDLDEEFVADFLACPAHAGPATPFRSVRRVEAGHCLSLAHGRCEIRRYWAPAEERLAGTGEGMTDQFLSVFKEAVHCSLDTGGKVWAELSGGLDSSAIVCLAHEILQGDAPHAPDFAVLTCVWKDTPQSDESPWAEAVAERCQLTHHGLVCDDLFFDGAAEESRYRSEPHFGIVCHPMIRAESELLRASGVDVLLSGARAEAVVLGDFAPPLHLADLLRGLELRPFVRELLRWQRHTHRPLANLLIPFALKPVLEPPRYFRSRDHDGTLDSWIDKGFAKRMGLQERSRKAIAPRHFRSRAQQLQYEHLIRSEPMIARGFLEWSCEVRHPFLYRPLVDLVLSIPWEQKVSPLEGKPLLRRSLQGRLPEEVRLRQGGAGPGPALYKAFARRWSAIEPVVRGSLLASMGFLDRKELLRAAELVRFGAAQRFASFLGVLSFEYWLRAVTGED